MDSAKPFLMLLGRILISLIFILSGINKLMDYEHTAQYMAAKQMPYVPFFLYSAAFVELLGGLSILVGFWARGGALILALFLIPVTLLFHDFWNVVKPEDFQMQMINFLKNLAIMGGLLYIFVFGAGAYSFRRSETF